MPDAVVRTPCPKCQGANLALIHHSAGTWLGGAFLFGALLFVIGFIFPPIWILIPIIWISGIFGALFPRATKWRCRDCNQIWKA